MENGYFGEFHDEIVRMRTLYYEARNLGMATRVKEVVDELYTSCFERYQLMVRQLEEVRKLESEIDEPVVKEIMRSFINNSGPNVNNFGRMLNEFALEYVIAESSCN